MLTLCRITIIGQPRSNCNFCSCQTCTSTFRHVFHFFTIRRLYAALAAAVPLPWKQQLRIFAYFSQFTKGLGVSTTEQRLRITDTFKTVRFFHENRLCLCVILARVRIILHDILINRARYYLIILHYVRTHDHTCIGWSKFVHVCSLYTDVYGRFTCSRIAYLIL